jgi:hypothetical protein
MAFCHASTLLYQPDMAYFIAVSAHDAWTVERQAQYQSQARRNAVQFSLP